MAVMFKRYKIFIGCVLMLISISGLSLTVNSKPLSNQQRQEMKAYYESGAYFSEIEKKLVDGKEYLDRQLQQKRMNRVAMVLDVDETALSNYRALERLSFTHNASALTAALMLANADPIPPVLALYQYAIANNVAVFFISSRPNTPEFLAVTDKNLKSAGYSKWDELVLKPIENDEVGIQDFKTSTRRRITSLGYDIVLNIGDQEADLEGGYAEARLRLPNPFYEHG